MWIYKRIKLIERRIIRRLSECVCWWLVLAVLILSLDLFAGDGKHRDPCGAQHPNNGGSGFHRHKLVGESCVPGLFGCKSLSSLESSPAGLVCWGSHALLSAPRRRGAQLCPAGSAGGVPEGRARYHIVTVWMPSAFQSQQFSSKSSCCTAKLIQIYVLEYKVIPR